LLAKVITVLKARLDGSQSANQDEAQRRRIMAVQVNLAKGLDKAYEDKTIKEILDAPPSALAGVSEGDAALLKQAFGIDTVREFGSNKYFALAGVLVALENKEG
jgi:hypothetical protein